MKMMSFPKCLIALSLLLTPPLLLSGCGGRSISKNAARQLIAESPLGLTNQEAVYIDSVSQTGGRNALIEARLNAAFRFEKVNGRWVMREVRLAGRPWEKVEDLVRCIENAKAEATRGLLNRIADAIEQYRLSKGSLPAFRDFVGLSDQLTPDFLTPLVRVDAWDQPLAAFTSGNAGLRLVSAGPDRKMGTSDDIELTRNYPR